MPSTAVGPPPGRWYPIGHICSAQAAAALAKLAYANEETRAAITTASGVKPLIKLLQLTGHPTVRRDGANALANLATDPNARDEIVGAGGIRPLVLVLEDENFHTKK